MEQRKILIVSSPWMGGSGTVALELSKKLSNKGHKVFLVSFDMPYRFKEKEDSNLVFVNVVPATHPLFSYPLYKETLKERIVELVEKWGIEIVHAHYSIIFGSAAAESKKILESKGIDVKFICTFHGTDLLGFKNQNGFKHTNQFIMDNAIVSTVSNWMADYMYQNYELEQNKVKVLPNFVDRSIFKRNKDTYLRKKIVHVSNFREVKRPYIVLETFKELKKVFPWLELSLIGEGPIRQNLEARVQSENISGVSFEGGLDSEAVAARLNRSLFSLIPSSFENFSLAFIESLSSGAIPVFTKTGGMTELEDNKQTAIGVSVENTIEEMVEEIKYLLNRREKIEEMSIKAAERAKNYDTEEVVQEYEKIYS